MRKIVGGAAAVLSLVLGSFPTEAKNRVQEKIQAGTPSEPSYCNPASFDDKEISLGEYDKVRESGIENAHAYRLGKVTLVGVAVGNSKAKALIELAEKYSEVKGDHYCTWYLNHDKSTTDDSTQAIAARTFIHRDIVKNPIDLSEGEAPKHFLDVLKNDFDGNPTSFLSCASQQHYIALGCNGMKHRGPTVFGMLLAYSGCTPEHALEIADQGWGLNGVKRKVRLAVIKKAYELGRTSPESRKKLAQVFSE